jgi:hypothetical protein
MQEYAKFLRGHSETGKRDLVQAIPVFSTIGEPSTVPRQGEREPWMILFGGGRWTAEVLSDKREVVTNLCSKLGLSKIIAIGAKANVSFNGPVVVEETGILPATEVSSLLLRGRIGVVNYFRGYLAKSTIFAAYCAHGIVSVLPEYNPSEKDGIVHKKHYLLPEDLDCPPPQILESVALQAREWYLQHNIEKTGSALAMIFDSDTT